MTNDFSLAKRQKERGEPLLLFSYCTSKRVVVAQEIVFVSYHLSAESFLLCFGLDLGWIQKHRDQLKRFSTSSFLEGMFTHLRKVEVLTSAEETKIKEAGQLQDQVNMLTTFVSGKDTQGSDALRGFIESSDSHVAQLIINYGKGYEMGFSL